MGEIKFIHYKKRIEKGKTVLETRPTPYYYEKDGTIAPVDEILNREEELCQKEASGKLLSLDEQIELELISKIPFAYQKHLLATITIDAEIDNVTVRGRNDAIRQAEEKAGIKHPYHFVWIDGAEKKKGIIEFPWDGYSKVYIVKGTYDKPEIIFLEEGKGYEIKDGKTFVYMDGFSGAGTAQEPFEVATAEDLSKVGTGTDGWNLDSYYIQTADIDLAGYSNWTKIGTYVNRFVGSYDGAGFEIKNLILQDSATGCGLFAYLSVGGHLSNIHLRNVSIAGYQRTGSLVGANYGTIERCSATGSVSATSSYCGGLVGVNESGGNIFESWCICDVTSSSIYGYVGGFTARNYGVITDCYAQGSVTGAKELGGFLGRNLATIERCYAAVQVIASNPVYVGGFCGYDQGTALRACYYDSQVAGYSDSGKGFPRTTAQMKNINTFVGWDISLKSVFDPQSPTIWFIDNGNDYPRLGWEFVPPESYVADLIRTIIQTQSYNADTKRPITQSQTYQADALRKINKAYQYSADTERITLKDYAYSADTKRKIIQDHVFTGDTKRGVIKEYAHTADTLRKLLKSYEYQADILRQVVKSYDYTADVLRRIAEEAEYQADAKRQIAKEFQFNADTLRHVIMPYTQLIITMSIQERQIDLSTQEREVKLEVEE